MQRIIIKNFGPIKEVDIPIQDFMIFIGPQASGKSTIARVIDFLKESPTFFAWYVRNLDKDIFLKEKTEAQNRFMRELLKEFQDKFTEIFNDLYDKGIYSITIYYNIEEDLFVTINNPQVTINFSNNLSNLFIGFFENIYSANETDKNDLILFTRNIRDSSKKLLKEQFGQETINTFIPAGRSLFSVLSDSFLLDRKISNLYYYRQFAQVLNQLRREYEREEYIRQIDIQLIPENDKIRYYLAKGIINQIIRGNYERNEKRDFIRIADDLSVFLENSSSGQQESLWILLLLLETIGSDGYNFFVIEEPEAHLYPEAQKAITELITLCVNETGNQVVITTHSPYILGALNNLIYAHYLGSRNEEIVKEKIPKELWLDYNRVATYFVDNGGVIDIMEEERDEKYGKLKMIRNEAIDSASRIINDEYDFLFNIEYSE